MRIRVRDYADMPAGSIWPDGKGAGDPGPHLSRLLSAQGWALAEAF